MKKQFGEDRAKTSSLASKNTHSAAIPSLPVEFPQHKPPSWAEVRLGFPG